MRILTVLLVGKSDLLMSNPQTMVDQIEEGKPGTATNTGPKTTMNMDNLIEAGKASRYLDEKGNMVFPSTAPRASLVGGCTGYKFGKIVANKAISGALLIGTEFFPVFRPDGTQIQGDDYELDIRRAVNKSTKKSLLAARARIKLPWVISCSYKAQPLVDDIGLDQIVKLWNIGGTVYGIGPYRPECKGWFGTYEVIDAVITEE